MLKLNKRLVAQVLATILALSVLQPGFARNHDALVNDTDCTAIEMLAAIYLAPESDSSCESDIFSHCFTFHGCTSSSNGSSMLWKSGYLEPPEMIVEIRYHDNAPALYAHFPALLLRPPITSITH